MKKIETLLLGILSLLSGIWQWVRYYLIKLFKFLAWVVTTIAIVVVLLAVCAMFNVLGVYSGCSTELMSSVPAPLSAQNDAINQCVDETMQRNYSTFTSMFNRMYGEHHRE